MPKPTGSLASVEVLLAKKSFLVGLTRALQIQLLAVEPQLLDQYRSASAGLRKTTDQALHPAAERLWAQARAESAIRSFVLEQFAIALESNPRATPQQLFGGLARALLPSIQSDLSEVFSRSLKLGGGLQLSVHPTSYACARYLASLVRVWPAPGQYFTLPTDAWIKASEHVEVAWQLPAFEPRAITAVQHELRAKSLMLLAALAATAQAEGQTTTAIYVGLSDLMTYFGYKAGDRANARYYWFHAAEVVRALLHDLPGHLVRLEGQPPQPLLRPPQVVFRDPRGWNTDILLSARDLSGVVREAHILGFYVHFESQILQMLSVDRAEHHQSVPTAFFSLHGSCFWMAWRVVYWQHWEQHQTYPLLRLLRECGYLEAHSRGGRTRYKQALRAWWADVGQLVEIGLLEEPGVRVWRRGKEVSDQLSRQLESVQSRIHSDALGFLEAAFAIPRN